MYMYTMTFVSGEVLGIPEAARPKDSSISDLITEKLGRRELELADFNWSGNYSFDNSLSYLSEPYRFNVVVEVRLRLDVNTIQSRKAIYDRCFDAVKLNEVHLTHIRCLHNLDAGIKCVLCFDIEAAA